MNRKQKNEAQMFLRVRTFAEERKPDFTNDPPKNGDETFAGTLTKLGSVIERLGGKAAIQAGGDYGEHTEEQKALRGEIEETLRAINRDVSTLATQRKQPSMMDRFRMPYGSGDEELRGKLRAFADAIEDLDLAAALGALGQEETPGSLRQLAKDFDESEGEQGVALGGQAGATAAILGLLSEGRGEVKVFHSLFSNRYKGNPELLGAWKTVSRVLRSGGNGDEEPPPAPPAPPPV
jgi:hypothetical protein